MLYVFYVSVSSCSRVRTMVIPSQITPAFTPSYTYTESQRGNAHTRHKYVLSIFIAHNRKKKTQTFLFKARALY